MMHYTGTETTGATPTTYISSTTIIVDDGTAVCSSISDIVWYEIEPVEHIDIPIVHHIHPYMLETTQKRFRFKAPKYARIYDRHLFVNAYKPGRSPPCQ